MTVLRDPTGSAQFIKEKAVYQREKATVLDLVAYQRAHAWALERARIEAGLRLRTPPTFFGLALRDDGIEAVVTISVAATICADERLRLEAAVRGLAGVDLVAMMEPVAGTPGTPTPGRDHGAQ